MLITSRIRVLKPHNLNLDRPSSRLIQFFVLLEAQKLIYSIIISPSRFGYEPEVSPVSYLYSQYQKHLAFTHDHP